MYLFINDPGSEFNVASLIKDKKAKAIPLEVSYDPNLKKEDIIKLLSTNFTDTTKISIVIFHPVGAAGMVAVRMIPLVVESIKEWIDVPLVVISAGGKEYLTPAKEAGADAALSTNEFYQVWEDCLGDEKKLLSWIKGFVSKKKVEHIVIRILSSFLPLDIDMQALAEIKNHLKKVNGYLFGDSDIEGMLQDKSNEHYRQKLYDLWCILNYDYSSISNVEPSEKVKNLEKIEASHPAYDSLKKLAGLDYNNPKDSHIYNFLKAFDKRKWDDDGELTNKTDSLCEPFRNNSLKINNKTITSFHNWYCTLAGCLRG